MRRQRFGTFTGGLDLPDDKQATLTEPITTIPAPAALRVPLDPCRLGDVVVEATVGRRVAAGERLATAGGDTPVFAPVDGRVGAITTAVLDDPAGEDAPRGVGYVCPAVELTDLAPLDPLGEGELVFNWEAAEAAELRRRIAEGGLTTCVAAPAPLGRFCEAAVAAGVDILIGDGMENQPYLTGEHRLLVERGAEAVKGLAMLRLALGAETAALAVDARRVERYRRIGVWAEALGVQLLAVEHKYPIGHPKMLTTVLTGRTPGPEQAPADVGVEVVNMAACLAAYRWVACGEPPVSRVVTVAGPGVGRPANVLAALGTPAVDLLAWSHAPADALIGCGGPMTGSPLPDGGVVGPGTAALLALPSGPTRPPTACIRCGWCTDLCPVRLDVASLNDMFELGQVDRARRYEAAACLGCGVCSYVCPARLPLAHRVRTLKRLTSRAAAETAGRGGAS